MKRVQSDNTVNTRAAKRLHKPTYDPSKPVPKFPLRSATSTDDAASAWDRIDCYKPVEGYVKKYGLLRHQFDMYNQFISNGIRTIIDDEGDLNITDPTTFAPVQSINFSNVCVRKPFVVRGGRAVPMMPNDARMSHGSYLCNVTADVTVRDLTEPGDDGMGRVVDRLVNKTICTVPCMVGSIACNLYGMSTQEKFHHGEVLEDAGGYFIVGGYDRIITSQVKRLYNGSVLYRKADQWICDMRSMNVETGKSVQICVHTGKNYANRVLVTIANSTSYCMIEVFMALGVAPENIINYVGQDIATYCSLTEGFAANRPVELIAAVRASKLGTVKINALVNAVVSGKKVLENETTKTVVALVRRALDDGMTPDTIISTVKWALSVAAVEDIGSLFPHIGNHGSNEARAQCLGRMVKRLGLAVTGKHTVDDRGDYANKRVETSGHLLTDLFKMLWKQFLADIKQCGLAAWTSVVPSIERDFKRCFQSGFWGAKNSTFKLNGVVETATVKASHQIQTCLLRKVKIYVNNDNKNRKIRELHPSTEYSLCISETVEGQDVGTRLALSICASTSCNQNGVLVISLIKFALKSLLRPVLGQDGHWVAVVVNGNLAGYVADEAEARERLDALRRRGALAVDTGISFDASTDTIDVYVDAGRLVRPVYDMRVATPELVASATSFTELEKTGAVVFRDVQELSAEPIVLVKPDELTKFPNARYCELHPACLYGVLAGDIVYVNHTQSPRACYMTCMARHSMGTRISLGPCAPQSYTLNMAQKPLVTTRLAQMCGFDESPNGVNAIVAVLSYSGFNQEDSVIINKSSLQRGMFSSTIQRVVTVETVPRTGIVEEICMPPNKTYVERAYRHLDESGLPRVGSFVEKGDVLVGRVARTTNGSHSIETSVVAKLHEDGLIKAVLVTGSTKKRASVIKIVLVETDGKESSGGVSGLCDIEIGDKVCSSMAQKGICGMLYNQEDMPFTADGMVPDIIINPHCMPSRMTINQYIASVLGKVAAVKGERYDGSPFQPSQDPFSDACSALARLGFDGDGGEVMYNGFTGEKYKTRVFIGPVYYRRLTQLVRYASFASVKNNVKNRITRQPLNGRINEGGLRVGEMESLNMLGHGVPRYHQEKFLNLSDDFTINVCSVCKSDGLVYRDSKGVMRCRPRLGAPNGCARAAPVVPVRLPAATRQLFHLTEAMNIAAKTEV